MKLTLQWEDPHFGSMELLMEDGEGLLEVAATRSGDAWSMQLHDPDEGLTKELISLLQQRISDSMPPVERYVIHFG